MATKRRKRKRSRARTTVSRSITRLSSSPRRRRKRSGFLSAGTKSGIKSILMNNGAAGIGGLGFAATRLIKMPLWVRLIAGTGGSIGLSMAGMPFVAAGMFGATTYHACQTLLPAPLLNDDGEDLEDADYVDPDTLSDSGYVDSNGNAVVMDDDGVMYALNDNGDLEAVGDAYSLQDNLQSVSMVPLQDAYSLSSPYSLTSRY